MSAMLLSLFPQQEKNDLQQTVQDSSSRHLREESEMTSPNCYIFAYRICKISSPFLYFSSHFLNLVRWRESQANVSPGFFTKRNMTYLCLFTDYVQILVTRTKIVANLFTSRISTASFLQKGWGTKKKKKRWYTSSKDNHIGFCVSI